MTSDSAILRDLAYVFVDAVGWEVSRDGCSRTCQGWLRFSEMMVLGKCVIWKGTVRLFRYRFWTALLAVAGLTQIGEFSYVLVQIARAAGLIVSEVYSATLAALLLSTVVNAFLVHPPAKCALRAGHPV